MKRKLKEEIGVNPDMEPEAKRKFQPEPEVELGAERKFEPEVEVELELDAGRIFQPEVELGVERKFQPEPEVELDAERKLKLEADLGVEVAFKIERAVEEYEPEGRKLPDAKLVTFSSSHPSSESFIPKQETSSNSRSSHSLGDDKPYILIDSDDEIEDDESILPSLPIPSDPIRLVIRTDPIRPEPPQQPPPRPSANQIRPRRGTCYIPRFSFEIPGTCSICGTMGHNRRHHDTEAAEKRRGTMRTFVPWDNVMEERSCSLCGLTGHNRRHHDTEVPEKMKQEFKRTFEVVKQSYLWFGGSQNAVLQKKLKRTAGALGLDHCG